jgi:hypothetical protein
MPIAQDTIRDLKADIRVARKMRLPWWGILSLIGVTIPIAWLFDRYGNLPLVLPFLDGGAVIVVAVVLKWAFRRCAWFWLTMLAIAALHVTLILLVHWPDHWVPAAVWGGWGGLDLFIMLALISVVRQLTGDANAR